jgi:hypothetical protein
MPGQPRPKFCCLCLPQSWDYRCITTSSFYWLRWSLSPGWPGTFILLVSTSQVVGITALSQPASWQVTSPKEKQMANKHMKRCLT